MCTAAEIQTYRCSGGYVWFYIYLSNNNKAEICAIIYLVGDINCATMTGSMYCHVCRSVSGAADDEPEYSQQRHHERDLLACCEQTLELFARIGMRHAHAPVSYAFSLLLFNVCVCTSVPMVSRHDSLHLPTNQLLQPHRGRRSLSPRSWGWWKMQMQRTCTSWVIKSIKISPSR